MDKRIIINNIVDKIPNTTKSLVDLVIDAYIEELKKALAQEGHVALTNFASLALTYFDNMVYFDPNTGEKKVSENNVRMACTLAKSYKSELLANYPKDKDLKK